MANQKTKKIFKQLFHALHILLLQLNIIARARVINYAAASFQIRVTNFTLVIFVSYKRNTI